MKSRYLAYGLAWVAATALGTACKSDGAPEVTFLEVLETAPTDGQMEFPVEGRIGFRVNAPIDALTLTTDNVVLTDEDGAIVPASLQLGDEPNIAELLPDEPLAVITTFTVTVNTSLTSTGGATLAEDFEWSFHTLDSAWGVSEWIEEVGTGTSSRQQIAVDGQSNALSAWQYTEPNGTGVWANRYTRTDLWGVPEPIDGGAFATEPRLAADGAGNGFVIWQQGEDVNAREIWGNRYVVEEGWGDPEIIQTDEVTSAQSPSLAADPAGNAIAVWAQRATETTDVVVWANRYEPESGWGTATAIDEMPSPSAPSRTSVSMDADGNAIAVWSRPTLMGNVLWANRYTTQSGWGTAELIKSDPDTTARDARLDVGAAGDAFVVWVQGDDIRNDIWAARFSGSSWAAPVRIDNHDDGDKRAPDVAVDGAGVAHAVWSQADADFENIWANQYTPGSEWGTPELIEPPNEDPMLDGDATTPRVGVNSAGNAFVVWRQTWESWGSVWSNRLDPGTGWMDAELIEEIDRPAKAPKIAVDENRHAHAVWLHSRGGGVDWVRTNRFE